MIEIPGYREAIAAEREARDYAFLELPRDICGIDAAPFTLHHLVTRLAIGCPFLCERSVMDRPDPAAEIASFIWHVSEARRRALGRPLAEYRARQAFFEKTAQLDTSAAVVAIHEYLNWTFLDAPPSGGACKRPPIASIASTIIDLFASEYGWYRHQVMHCPLEQLYQLIREITVRKNPKAVLFNRRSDKVRGQYLNSLNAATLQPCNAPTSTPEVSP
jgi:hypothetical protein